MKSKYKVGDVIDHGGFIGVIEAVVTREHGRRYIVSGSDEEVAEEEIATHYREVKQRSKKDE